MPDFELERKVFEQGYRSVAGIDEVGRGALFGPVVAAAVMFPPSFVGDGAPSWMRDVDDSKRLSPPKRERLAALIVQEAESVGLGWRSNGEIDRLNIFRASCEAMKSAAAVMALRPDYLLVDGLRLPGIERPQMKVVGGDGKSLSIAAASIIAKVFRDTLITRLAGMFAGYGLAANKGYGTRDHYRGLRRCGPTPLHRLSFNLGPAEGKNP